MKSVSLLCIALLATPVWAINKCVGADGRVVYQQGACPGQPGAQAQPQSRSPQPSSERKVLSPEEMARSFDAQTESAVRQQAADAEKYRGQVNWEHVRQGMAAREEARRVVQVGMTASEVTAVMGRPASVNRTATALGTSEQWVFVQGRGKQQYVYLSNGVVTLVQTPE